MQVLIELTRRLTESGSYVNTFSKKIFNQSLSVRFPSQTQAMSSGRDLPNSCFICHRCSIQHGFEDTEGSWPDKPTAEAASLVDDDVGG